MEEDEQSGKGLWIALFVVALLAALVFGTLWYLRGGDIYRLNNAIAANQSAADATTTRLERELRSARSEADAGSRKITELENRVKDEQRRSTEMAQQVERRLRGEVDSANSRVRDLTSQLSQLRNELAEKDSARPTGQTGSAEVAGVAAGVGLAAAALPMHAEVEELKRQLADARSSAEEREKELYKRIADAEKEKEELEGELGDLKANINHIGQELTTANEDLEKIDALEKELAEAKETIKTLEAKIGDLEANASHLRGELKSAQDDLSKALQDAGRTGDVEKELTTARKTIEDLQKRNALLDAGHGSLKKELAVAGAAAAAAGAATLKIKDLEAKFADSQKSLAAAAKEKEELLADNRRLRGNEDANDKTIQELLGRLGAFEKEHEGLRKELSDTSLNLQKAQSEAVKGDLVGNELAAAKKTIEGLHSQIAALEEHRSSLRNDLAQSVADLEKARSDQPVDVLSLEEKVRTLSGELEVARKQSIEARGALEQLGPVAEREKELRAKAERLERENLAVRSEVIELRNRAKAEADAEKEKFSKQMNDAIAKLEADAQKKAGSGEADLAAAKAKTASLEGQIEKLRADLEKARGDSAASLAAVKKEYNERLANDRKRMEEREKELQARCDERVAGLRKEAPAAAAPVAEEAPAAPKLSDTPAGASGVLSGQALALPDPTEPGGVIDLPVEPTHYYIQDPERSVGEIIGMAPMGGYVVSVGSRQGVKPGMLFDVHRPLGGMNWYLGVLRIDRVMGETAEAGVMSCPGVKICPVTGRAVLDSQMRYSPFVFADGGKAVPLISAESLGLGGELPDIGDRIDNPYFDPARPLGFILDSEVREGEPKAAKAVEALGARVLGEGVDEGDADYMVVGEYDPENVVARPRRVTAGQVESYVDPGRLSGM